MGTKLGFNWSKDLEDSYLIQGKNYPVSYGIKIISSSSTHQGHI